MRNHICGPNFGFDLVQSLAETYLAALSKFDVSNKNAEPRQSRNTKHDQIARAKFMPVAAPFPDQKRGGDRAKRDTDNQILPGQISWPVAHPFFHFFSHKMPRTIDQT